MERVYFSKDASKFVTLQAADRPDDHDREPKVQPFQISLPPSAPPPPIRSTSCALPD